MKRKLYFGLHWYSIIVVQVGPQIKAVIHLLINGYGFYFRTFDKVHLSQKKIRCLRSIR